jgi:hypothetical protein
VASLRGDSTEQTGSLWARTPRAAAGSRARRGGTSGVEVGRRAPRGPRTGQWRLVGPPHRSTIVEQVRLSQVEACGSLLAAPAGPQTTQTMGAVASKKAGGPRGSNDETPPCVFGAVGWAAVLCSSGGVRPAPMRAASGDYCRLKSSARCSIDWRLAFSLLPHID